MYLALAALAEVQLQPGEQFRLRGERPISISDGGTRAISCLVCSPVSSWPNAVGLWFHQRAVLAYGTLVVEITRLRLGVLFLRRRDFSWKLLEPVWSLPHRSCALCFALEEKLPGFGQKWGQRQGALEQSCFAAKQQSLSGCTLLQPHFIAAKPKLGDTRTARDGRSLLLIEPMIVTIRLYYVSMCVCVLDCNTCSLAADTRGEKSTR